MLGRFAWNRLYGTSIKTKIFVYYASLIVIIFIACSFFLYTYMQSYTRNLVGDYTSSATQQTSAKLDAWMQEIETLSKAIMWNANVRNIMVYYEQNGVDSKDRSELYNYLTLLMTPRDDIYSIQFVENNSFPIRFGNYFDDMNGMLPTLEALDRSNKDYQGGSMVFTGSVLRHAADNGKMTFFAARKIYDKFTFTTIGDMVIEVDYSKLRQVMRQLDNGKSKAHYLLDPTGRVIYSDNEKEIGQQAAPEYAQFLAEPGAPANFTRTISANVLAAFSQSDYTGWYVVSATPLSEIVSPFQRIQQMFLLVNLIGISIALILAAMLSRSITRPLTKLVGKMKGIRIGNIKLDSSQSLLPVQQGYNEIQKINDTFNDMIASINRMIQESYEAELKQKETELKVLRAQINPHFLYNTLDVINWKLVINNQNDISKLVRALTSILRYNIAESGKPVRLREEIAQIDNYLKIQQARFEDRIELVVDIDPEVMELVVCKFLLQPIVENAVMHGFKQREEGTITIRGQVRDGTLTLEVGDNGGGIDRQTLDSLQRSQSFSSSNSTGIGIHNISQRMALYYGNEYGIRFASEPGLGTTVTLTLPAAAGADE
ncbi:cache domain-containing sensor histidine kinase [Paenibacillus cymbidii]|uniref:cache domain-containing sensor histidine kinase n=1 Tax=Paenibacillus cymbidii TaxID=1639034 RepID=UPI0010801221|nr:sensor histidine kinase [Paenibacillus cymbidii]